MTLPTTDRRLRRDLAAIRGDGVAFSLMVGLGETYIPAFALAAGLGSVTAGLATSVPLLGGALLQLVSPFAVRKIGSRRTWVVACVTLQAACYAPLAIAALCGRVPTLALFAITCLYWGASMGAGPAWSGWVGTIVPARLRTSYWAERSRLGHLALLAGLLVGGAVLHFFAPPHRLDLMAFAALFAAAGLCRAISARCLASIPSEAALPPARVLGTRTVVARLGRGETGRLLRFALALQGSVQVAGPFFTPYMLRQLHLPYTAYVILLAASYGAKIISMPLVGRAARRHGALRLLRLGALGIVPLPALWLVSSSLPWLVAVNVLSGVVWATYELSLFLLVFETVEDAERTSVLAAHNVANALVTVGGAALGAILLQHGGVFAPVFALSSLLRAATLPLVARLRTTTHGRMVPSWTVRPSPGFSARPLAPSIAASPSESSAQTERWPRETHRNAGRPDAAQVRTSEPPNATCANTPKAAPATSELVSP